MELVAKAFEAYFLAGSPEKRIHRFQVLQNTAARVVTKASNITPTILKLYQLSDREPFPSPSRLCMGTIYQTSEMLLY